MAVHDYSWPFLVLHVASWSFYSWSIHILERNHTRAAWLDCWNLFAFYQRPSGFQVSLLYVVRCCKILSSIGTEPQIVLCVYLLSLFHSKCLVHFAVLSVSSLCTDEQSVADVAKSKTGQVATHLQLCPAIGVSSSNSSLDMEYRSRDMLNHVCVCMCEDHNWKQNGACLPGSKETAASGARTEHWGQRARHSVESCDGRGLGGMYASTLFVIIHGPFMAHTWAFGVHDYSWPFLVLHVASWSFYSWSIHILERNHTRAAWLDCWNLFAFYQRPSGFQVSLLDVVRCCKILSSIGTEPQIVLCVYLFSLFHRKCWVHFAVLSVSSLCTDEQSVADVAKSKTELVSHIYNYVRP